MSRAISISEAASFDLAQVFAFIAERNLDAAGRLLEAVDQDLVRLAEMPGLGTRRVSRNAALHGMRSPPVSGFRNYLLFYRATDDRLELLRVIHGARDVRSILDED